MGHCAFRRACWLWCLTALTVWTCTTVWPTLGSVPGQRPEQPGKTFSTCCMSCWVRSSPTIHTHMYGQTHTYWFPTVINLGDESHCLRIKYLPALSVEVHLWSGTVLTWDLTSHLLTLGLEDWILRLPETRLPLYTKTHTLYIPHL